MAAEIITLQEVQKDAYEEWFRPELLAIGYESVFQQKKREPIFHRGKYTAEGCATFWKTSRFKRVEKQVIDYDKSMAEHLRCMSNQQDMERGLQRAAKGNIALAVVLEDTTSKETNSGHAVGNMVCVVNTHILADPGFVDVKLWQAHLLVQAIEQAPWKHMPLIICGDFNSTPESAVYEYMHQGALRSDHEELRTDPCGLLQNVQFEHTLRLTTAYETCSGKEAEYTNFTEEFKGTLDYIFFGSNCLTVLAISQVDEEAQLKQETALPSSTRPSDHVSLVATFMFRNPPADMSSQMGLTYAGSGLGGSLSVMTVAIYT
jgi:CCR4-NOT transcription complex subunit 6